MAKDQKEQPSPARTIEAPQALVPLMQAFHVDSERVAKDLISETAHAIYGRDGLGRFIAASEDELNGIISLMRGLDPRDTLETLYAAQIVVSHMLGMKKLTQDFADDQRLGLNLLRFSSEAMQMLSKKRSGGMQNITVEYNYNGQGNAIMQTVVPKGESRCQSEE